MMTDELSEDEFLDALTGDHDRSPEEAAEALAYLQAPVPDWITATMVRVRDALISGQEPDPKDLENLSAHLEGGWNAKQ